MPFSFDRTLHISTLPMDINTHNACRIPPCMHALDSALPGYFELSECRTYTPIIHVSSYFQANSSFHPLFLHFE